MSDGQIVIDIVMDDGDVRKGVANLADLEKTTGKAGRGIKEMVSAMGLVKVASAAFNVLKNSVGAAVSRFDTMQKYPKVMQSLGYSANDSSKSIDKLSNGIDGLPTKLDDIVATNQRMVSISGNIDKATDATVALNNAFLASGASTDDAARGMDQYIKMLSTGKVEADNWDTLMETMPVSLTKVANAMGYMGNDAMVQLKKALQDGNITFDQFQDKIIELGTGTGELAKLAKINSEGIGTSFNNLKNTVSKNLGNMLTKLDEITQKVTGKTIAGNIDSLKYLINDAFNAVIKSMDKVIPTIEKVTAFVKENQQALKILASIIGIAITAILAYGTAISAIKKVTAVTDFVSGAAKAFKGLTLATNASTSAQKGFNLIAKANPIGIVVAAITALTAAFIIAYQKSETFRNKVDGIMDTLKKFSAPIMDVIKAVKIMGQTLSTVLSGNALPAKLNDLRNKFTKLLPEELFNKILQFAWKLNDIKLTVKAVIGVITGSIKSFDDFQESVFGVFNNEVTKNIWNFVKGTKDVFKNMNNSSGAAKTAGKNFDVFNIAIKLLKSILLGLMGPFGLVIKAISLVAKALGGGDVQKGIKSILTSFENLTKGIQTNGPQIGRSFGQALQGILTAIGEALPGIILGGIQIITGLITGIAQGLPLIAAAAIQLITSFTVSMLTLIPVVAAAGLAIVTSILTEIANALPQLIMSGANVLLQFITGLTSVIPDLVTATVRLITTYLNTVASNLPKIIESGANLLIKFIDGITEKLPVLAKSTVNLIVTFLGIISKNLPKILSSAIDLMIKFVDGLIQKMPDIVNAATRLIVSFLGEISNNLGDVISAGVDLVVKIVQGIGDNLGEIVTAAGDLVDKLVESIIEIADRMAKAAIRLVNGLADGIRDNTDEAKKAGENLLDAILEAIPGGGLLQTGKDLASGLADGISAGWDWVTEAAKSLAGGAVTSARKELDEHSPSKVFREIGEFTGQGMVLGMRDSESDVSKSSAKMAGLAVSSAKKELDIHSPSKKMRNQVGKNIALGVAEGITVYGKTAEEASKKAMKKITDKIAYYQTKYDADKMSSKTYQKNLKAIQKNSGLTASVRNKLRKELYDIDSDIAKKQKKVNDGITKANTDYLNSTKKINSELAKNIKDTKAEYTKQVNDLAKSIYNQTGLFAEVKVGTVEKSVVSKNLKDQVNQFKKWQSNINKIAKTAPKGFVDEIREMGVGSANQVQALASMTSKELTAYVNLWKQKHNLAKQEAIKQSADEKAAMKARIKALTATAKKELDAATKTWKAQLAKLKADAKDLEAFKGNGKAIGKNIASGLVSGMRSMQGVLSKQVKSMASKVVKDMKKSLGIHSPSRVMRDQIGKYIPQGIALGINGDKSVYKALDTLNKGMTAEVALGANRMGNAAVGSQIVNNTYNNQRAINLDDLARVISSRPVQVESYLDGEKVSESVDYHSGATLRRRLYTGNGGMSFA